MEAKELRIGNYVYQDGEFIQGITCLSIYKFDMGNINLEPIELTKDWLIKFGYTKEDSNFWFIGHIVWEYDDGIFICNKNGITLKYVHQLQNLYFALTGKELKLQNTAE